MHCSLCQSEVIEQQNVNDRLFWSCSQCGLVFLDLHFHFTQEEESKRYASHENSVDDERYVKYLTEIVDDAFLHCAKIDHVLDYGCGENTVMAQLIDRRGIKCDRYDPIYGIDDIKETSKYDLIIASESAEHFFNPREEFLKMKKLLTTTGTIYLKTEILTDEIDFKSWWYKNDETHVCFYSLKTIEWLAIFLKMEIKAFKLRNKIVLSQK